jgi:hypothetical protein
VVSAAVAVRAERVVVPELELAVVAEPVAVSESEEALVREWVALVLVEAWGLVLAAWARGASVPVWALVLVPAWAELVVSAQVTGRPVASVRE